MNTQGEEVNMGYFEDLGQKIKGMWQLMTGDLERQREQGMKGGQSSRQRDEDTNNNSEHKTWEDEEE